MSKIKVAVAGLGYVGLSNAILLAQKNTVFAIDLSAERVSKVNARQSPLDDAEMRHYLTNIPLDLHATLDSVEAFSGAEFIVVATPTNYDVANHSFDTSSVESVIAQAREIAPDAYLVIKSTIPVGFVSQMREKFGTENIVFSPEFLREGRALYDNLYPSRIIVGAHDSRAQAFAELLRAGSKAPETVILFTGSNEAEAIKLFSNTYLAMRVSYFNELDSYAIKHNLNAREVVEGMGYDPRIGAHYNNPSFGYGGYCLPKDTKQLRANFEGVPQNLISAIVESNETRKDYLVKNILEKQPRKVGVYRLAMKAGADNYRDSAILGLVSRLIEKGISIEIYEPTILASHFMNCPLITDLETFKRTCDLIITNRMEPTLHDVTEKVFTRDVFGAD